MKPLMNRRMIGTAWARREQLGERLGLQQQGRVESAVQAAPERANAFEPAASDAAKGGQRDALSAWEDEGGTTKLVMPRKT